MQAGGAPAPLLYPSAQTGLSRIRTRYDSAVPVDFGAAIQAAGPGVPGPPRLSPYSITMFEGFEDTPLIVTTICCVPLGASCGILTFSW